MSYNTLDLLDKAVFLANLRKSIYKDILNISTNDKDKIVIKVLIRHTKKDIEIYEALKKALENNPIENIDFLVYDSAANLVNNFAKTFNKPNIKNLKELLEFAISVEEKSYALFLDIQGRVFQSQKNDNSQVYVALGRVISRKKENIDNIRMFYNRLL